ncbi:hypothetical protein, partial [Desulfobulbus sp.]|uniref:hypothetical protein n=1 Tax=Desulfobulbus sp. TaxID=895 RepID=UPI0027BB1756
FFATETYEKYVTISWNDQKYSYWKGNGWDYIKSREKGWHEIRFQIQRNDLSLYFDNTIVAQNLHYALKLKDFSWSSNIIAPDIEAYSWIDDFIISKKKYSITTGSTRNPQRARVR